MDASPPKGSRALRRAALDVVRQSPGISKIGVARALGVSPSAASLVVRGLHDEGIVVTSGQLTSSGGRPAQRLLLNSASPLMLGIDLGESEARFGVLGLDGRLKFVERAPLVTTSGSVAIEPLIAQAKTIAAHTPSIQGVGVAVPGLLTDEGSQVRYAANLGWTEVPLRDHMTAELGLPVHVSRNAHAALLAEEWWGSRPDADPVAFVTVGTGIGVAIKASGTYLRGVAGVAGELGHIPMSRGGALCRCGNRGCLETLVSARALVESSGDRSLTGVSRVVDAARRGHRGALAAVVALATSLGDALATLIGIVNPGAVVLGGELMEASDIILPIVNQRIREHSLAHASGSVTIYVSALGEHTALMGAATLGFEHLFSTGPGPILP